jgi:hypothetical protein
MIAAAAPLIVYTLHHLALVVRVDALLKVLFLL